MLTEDRQEEGTTTSFSLAPQRQYLNTIRRFKNITRFYGLIKLFFFFLIFFEAFFLFVSFSLIAWTLLFASLIATLFLTLFSFLVLNFYFQTKKSEQIANLKERFLQSSRQLLALPEKTAEHHLSIAQASAKLVHHLEGQEFRYFVFPKYFSSFNGPLERLSFYLFHEDVFSLKEQLLFTAIEEHLEQIRTTPTDLEVHASLATTYVNLAKLYKEVLENDTYRPLFRKMGKALEEKLLITSKRSIEELKILNDFAPNDPWVHAQLAQCYRALGKKREEAQEYEAILKISPQDHEILFRLGVAYFELGENAKGLKIYEELKAFPHKKAEYLLNYYGAVKDQSLLLDGNV